MTRGALGPGHKAQCNRGLGLRVLSLVFGVEDLELRCQEQSLRFLDVLPQGLEAPSLSHGG